MSIDHDGGTREQNDFDVAIIGGSFAGLSAAYPLVRARRSTVLFDAGQTRNRFSDESHNFLGLDGAAPSKVQSVGREELAQYENFHFRSSMIESVTPLGEDHHLGLPTYELTTTDGETYRAKRLILAMGMRDILPNVPGMEACWGKSALQCPYCHGFEMRDQPTAILHGGPPSLHQAKNLPDFSSDLLFLTNGLDVEEADLEDLKSRGCRIETRKVARLIHQDGLLSAIELEDGAQEARSVLYILPRAAFASNLGLDLDCTIIDGPFGPYLEVDDLQETNVRGVFAAGDMTRPAFNAVWAAADGNRAGIFAHQSLVTAHNPYRGAKL
ncbi:MAG: NAD(P)/FAD-dependent oxidoreductase [Myxococcota bacterium]